MFADQVKSGALPPVAKRIPKPPWIVRQFAGGDGPGRQGGQLNMLVASARDTRLMTVYSYTRLIVYDEKFKLHPDILESYENKDGREFTFKLRAGHRWSDGQPFTTEDFRFFWEDVANNKELSPSGPSVELLVDGQPPKVEIIDDAHHQVQLGQAQSLLHRKPGARRAALPVPAGALPQEVPSPSTPTRRRSPSRPRAARAPAGCRSTAGSTSCTPTTTSICRRSTRGSTPRRRRPSATSSRATRSITASTRRGSSCPISTSVIFTLAATNLVPAKAGLGEADLQPRYLNMRDYTFLQKSAKSSGVDVRLWESGSGSQIALYPNLNANDEEWRKLMRDVRFRRALSVAIDRDELNQVVYIGLAKPSNNTIMERSELFKPEYATKWAQFDPKLANKLLDEIGLTKRDPQGIRLLPDGRPAIIVVENSSEETEDSDALQLIAEYWKKIGIKMLSKPQTRENFRLRTFSGEAIMTAFAGAVTAVPTPQTSPKEFAPTMQGGLQWSRWGMYIESKGKQGEKCDLESACKLLDYVKEWEHATNDADRSKAWEKILQANADEVFSIGTVNGIRQPVVVGPKIRNVPKEGYYAWDPGGYIGLYQPDTFWVAP